MYLSVNGTLKRDPAILHDIHGQSILQDYRTFDTGADDYYVSTGKSLGVSYSYRNTPIGLFIGTIGSYSWDKSRIGLVQNFIGDYILYSYRFQPTNSQNAMVSFRASKSLEFLRGSIGLRSNYVYTSNSILSDGIETDYKSRSYYVSPYIMGAITSYLNWELRYSWRKSVLNMTNISTQSANSFIYSGKITITPCKLLLFTVGGEYYRNEVSHDTYKNMFMLDSKVVFNVSKRVDISATVTNILNHKDYGYTVYGTLSQSTRTAQLRGREFMLTISLKK